MRICVRGMFAALIVLSASSCKEKANHRFTPMDASDTHIDFNNTLFDNEPLNVLNYIYFYNGGGVAVGDINNDGLPDILFTGNMVRNRLYLNKGNFVFEDITKSSGIDSKQGWCTGATMVDINGDGKLDIYICRSADANPAMRRNLLFINNGDLSFSEKAAEYGLADPGYSTQAAFFDYDKDGDLDMFLINHSLHQYATGAIENPGWRKEKQSAFECKLFRNDQSDSLHHPFYTDVSAAAGIHSNVLTFGLGLAISDLNNDGWPDVYVSNDFNEPDYFFVNNGNGTFTEKLKDAMDQTSLYSMGSDAADYNNDGLVDLITLDMLPEDNHTQKMHSGAENFNKFQLLFNNGFYYQYSRNMLQTNNGDGTFSETGQLSGVSNTNWSWSALFTDFDNDGNKDLFVSNGYVKDYTDMDFLKYSADRTVKTNGTGKDEAVKDFIDKMPSSVTESYLFRNSGDGRFAVMNDDWGINRKGTASGAAYADLDNDGDMDLIVSETNGLAGIYRNNSRQQDKNHYLKIKLSGSNANPDGIGAKLTLFCGNKIFFQEQEPVRGYQSSVDRILTIGIGKNETIDSLRIIWPDDHYQVMYNQKPDQQLMLDIRAAKALWHYKVDHPADAWLHPAVGPNYTTRTPDLHDFDRQPLMMNYLSRQGPRMAKADINHDGRVDLFIGGSQGQPGQLFLQGESGQWMLSRQPEIEQDSLVGAGAVLFFDANADGYPDLLIAPAGYALNPNDPELQCKLYLNDRNGHFKRQTQALPALSISSGCAVAADVDGDGDLDLFIGGRVIPGQYPLSPGSRIWLNNGKGIFTEATERIAPALLKLGMVTDAVWTDLDKDGYPDLMIVGEWMPISIFLNKKGKLVDASSSYIHFASTGLWNCIFTADFDGDGDQDFILGNQGLNNQFTASEQQPLQLYYKDFDGNGILDPVFCYYIHGIAYPAASRDDLTGQIPSLKKKFIAYNSYADATITDLFSSDQLKDAPSLKVAMTSSIYLKNNGATGLSQTPLPIEAQYAPIYAIDTLDINLDGKPDLMMAGNNAWTRIRFGRYRANHGTVFLGDGKGNFTYVPQNESGLAIRGDVRSIVQMNTAHTKEMLIGIADGPVQAYQLKTK